MAFFDELEPAAAKDPANLTRGERIAFSQAISARRQAHASERIAQALEQLAGELAHPEWGLAPSIRRASAT